MVDKSSLPPENAASRPPRPMVEKVSIIGSLLLIVGTIAYVMMNESEHSPKRPPAMQSALDGSTKNSRPSTP